MSQTVAALLVGVLEQIGVRQIFGLIGDFSTRWEMPSNEVKSNGLVSVTKKAPRWQRRGRQSSPVGLLFVREQPDQAAHISLPVSMKPAAITHRSWPYQVKCPAS